MIAMERMLTGERERTLIFACGKGMDSGMNCGEVTCFNDDLSILD